MGYYQYRVELFENNSMSRYNDREGDVYVYWKSSSYEII